MSHRPITDREAADLCLAIERAWNTRNPSVVVRLLRADTVWRDNDLVHVGRGEIWTALKSKWDFALHYQIQLTLQSHDALRIAISFEAEWQDSVHGSWNRTRGQAEFHFDDERQITTFESSDSHSPITTTERRLSIAPVRSNP